MKLSENIKPISYLQEHAAEVIQHLQNTHQTMVITQNGEAAVIMQSITDYEQTQDTLALLKILAQSQQAVKENKTVLTPPYVDAGTKRLTLSFASPVKINNQLAGVALMILYLILLALQCSLLVFCHFSLEH
jgi:PHD/YefM family antitoxin component YafN of YafNO toxin-antitoxin module